MAERGIMRVLHAEALEIDAIATLAAGLSQGDVVTFQSVADSVVAALGLLAPRLPGRHADRLGAEARRQAQSGVRLPPVG